MRSVSVAASSSSVTHSSSSISPTAGDEEPRAARELDRTSLDRSRHRPEKRQIDCLSRSQFQMYITLSLFYKGWLIRDGNMGLVEMSKNLGMED